MNSVAAPTAVPMGIVPKPLSSTATPINNIHTSQSQQQALNNPVNGGNSTGASSFMRQPSESSANESFANQSINGDFPLQQVGSAEQFTSYTLPFWGAAVVAGPQNVTTAPPPIDNAPLLTPTSPHWNTTGTNGGGIPPPLNTQPILFQNISDPAPHSPYSLDASILSQSPLFTPANFYSPATPQYPHAAAFAFPPVDWTGANSMAASYMGSRNAAGTNLAFFNNIPPTSNGQSMNESSVNGNLRKVTEGVGQMNLGPGPGDVQRLGAGQNANNQSVGINLPSPRFPNGQQLNILQSIEPNSPNFVTEMHNKFFPPIDQGKGNSQQKDVNLVNQLFMQHNLNSGGADNKTQSYANMLRTGDNIPPHASPQQNSKAPFGQGNALNQQQNLPPFFD